MSTQTITLEQLRVRGIDALNRELGSLGMVRFLQQFEMGHGDYSKERHEMLDALSLDDAKKGIDELRK